MNMETSHNSCVQVHNLDLYKVHWRQQVSLSIELDIRFF